MNVKVRPIFELLDTYVSPDEDRRTYEGNAAKKVEAAFESWDKMSEQERVDRLKHLGIVPVKRAELLTIWLIYQQIFS